MSSWANRGFLKHRAKRKVSFKFEDKKFNKSLPLEPLEEFLKCRTKGSLIGKEQLQIKKKQ